MQQNMQQKKAASPILRFIVLALCALALQGLPFFLMRLEGDAGAALYFILLYGVIPLCAVGIPLWAGLGGVHPLAACLPIGGLLLLLPVYQSPGIGVLCVALSLVGCVAGREWAQRKEEMKGKHHGGKRKR